MNEDRITVRNALRHGDLSTKLSAIFMGAGMLGHRQIIKGVLVFAFNIIFWYYMITAGFFHLFMLPSLGTQEQGKVWNEAKQIYEYSAGDNSQQILLAGVITIFVVAAIIMLWVLQLRHSYKLQKLIENGEEVPTLKQDIKSLFNGNGSFADMTKSRTEMIGGSAKTDSLKASGTYGSSGAYTNAMLSGTSFNGLF